MFIINPYRYGGGGGGITDPNDISGCITWLDGTDDGPTANVWACKAANSMGNWDASGSYPVDQGDGSFLFASHAITTDKLDDQGLTEAEIFVRLRRSSSGDSALWRFTSADDWYQYSGTAYIGFCSPRQTFTLSLNQTELQSWHTINSYAATNDWAFIINGNVDKTLTSLTPTFGGNIKFGKMDSAGYYFGGYMASLVIYDHKLSTADRAAVTAYMDTLMV